MQSPFGNTNQYAVSYKLSGEYLKQCLIETGTKPESTVKHVLTIDALTVEQRAALVAFREQFREIGGVNLKHYRIAESFLGEPTVSGTENEYDHVLSEDEVLSEMAIMLADRTEKEAELKGAVAAYKAKKEAAAELTRQMKEKAAAEREAAIKAAKAEAAAPIEFKGGKAVLNLYKRIVELITGDSKTPARSIRQVTGIDSTKKDGYMYVGEFINAGAVEIDDQDKCFLANMDGKVYLVTMRDGVLGYKWSATDGRGWALVLREHVQTALADMPTKVEVPVVPVTPDARATMDKALAALERRDVRIDGMEDDPFALMEALMSVIKEQSATIKRLREELE